LGHGQDSIRALRLKVVKQAESQLYVRELTGHNDGLEVEIYLKLVGMDKGQPWCGAYVSWVFFKAGVKTIRSARAADWFKTNIVYKKTNLGQKVPDLLPAQTVAFWYNNLGRIGHIVIVEKDMQNSVATIGGNTSAKGEREGQGVSKKIFPKSMIYAVSDHVQYSKQLQ
jgi:hypothetical protein